MYFLRTLIKRKIILDMPSHCSVLEAQARVCRQDSVPHLKHIFSNTDKQEIINGRKWGGRILQFHVFLTIINFVVSSLSEDLKAICVKQCDLNNRTII